MIAQQAENNKQKVVKISANLLAKFIEFWLIFLELEVLIILENNDDITNPINGKKTVSLRSIKQKINWNLKIIWI